MQAVKANGYITSEGYLVVNAALPIPPGKVEVIVRTLQTEVVSQQNTEGEKSYTPKQKAVIAKFLKAAGAIKSGDPDSSMKVDEVVYGRK